MYDQLLVDLENSGVDMRALNEEFTSGLNFERVKVMARDHQQAEVRTQRNPGIDGFGYCSSEVPQEAYFDWAIKHPGIWQDPSGRKDILKRNPQWVRKYKPKAQVGWRALQSKHAVA